MTDTILRFEDVHKAFFGVTVLESITLEIERGSIVGLVGENGAGKSTLMNILGGVVPLDAGQMLLDGEAYAPHDPRDADHAGIAFIHQELNLFTNLTIAENFFISGFPTMGKVPLLSRGEIRRRAQEFLAMVDLDVSPDVKVERLAPGERQLVEIAKALSVDARHPHLRRAHDVAHGPRDGPPVRAHRPPAPGRQDDHLHLAHPARRHAAGRLDRRPARRCPRGPRAQVGVHHPQHDRGHGGPRYRAALPGPHLAPGAEVALEVRQLSKAGISPPHRPGPAQG